MEKEMVVHCIMLRHSYFPADKPKYSCIVMVHEPSTVNNNYYGADVAGPVLKG
jgi:cell division protein FtsI/penicillin-binding protein 2